MEVTKNDKYLFISCGYGYLRQFSIDEQIIIKDFGKVMSHTIRSIGISHDSSLIFATDTKGFMKSFSIERQALARDFGSAHKDHIHIIGQSDRYIFTTD